MTLTAFKNSKNLNDAAKILNLKSPDRKKILVYVNDHDHQYTTGTLRAVNLMKMSSSCPKLHYRHYISSSMFMVL